MDDPAVNRTPPVFFDENGKRWRHISRAGVLAAVMATAVMAVFVLSVLINPFLPQIRLKPFVTLPQRADTGLPIPELSTVRPDNVLKRSTEKVRFEKKKREDERLRKIAAGEIRLAGLPVAKPEEPANGRQLSIGFYVNWDDSSLASLKQHISALDWVVPEWVRLSGNEDQPLTLDIDREAMDLIRQERPDMPVLPLLQNYKNEKWDSSILSASTGTESARQKLISAILALVEKEKFGGITIDIEEVSPNQQTQLFAFVEELHEEFEKRGLKLAQALPFDNPDWNYKAYAAVTDYTMLMAYDQHWSTGESGPIASQPWFESVLKRRMAELSSSKTIICLGAYGYNWSSGGHEAETVSFEEALLDAKESLDSPADIRFDPASRNPYFTYEEDDGQTHTVWFLDAITAFNQIKTADEYQPAGFALWRLGSEDPSLWSVFGSDTGTLDPDMVTSIKYGYDVDFRGTGEILQVKSQPQEGRRELQTDPNGSIVRELYKVIPSSYVILRTGDKVGKIALTFDDGPDPEWTPKILDILKAENVKACFFVVGENGQANPDLVKRIVADGHEIGNHSYTHPNLAEVPMQVTDLELNSTQRLIESLTGRSTRLFRAPYFGDAEPRTSDELVPTVQAQNLGYISVGLHLDPDDWKLVNDDGTQHSPEQIVNEVVTAAGVTTPEERGSIVLLHDAGGDRSATVNALPAIIHELRSRGYEFTTVADLADITHDQAMPPVPNDQTYYSEADSIVFYLLSLGGWLFKWIFLAGILFGIGRIGMIGVLAFAQFIRSRRREQHHFGEGYLPFVSVVVPAYNEAMVIRRTIDSLLRSEYQNFEILVVDDGSTDDTSRIVSGSYATEKRVSLFRKENAGKAEALNFGCKKANGEIIVALDADTIFAPQTLSTLTRRFADPKIGAVAGNAKVGNRINIVTKWQALEYVTSQNFDRRAFASLNCITVVPGSVGAWRRSVIEECGGFSSRTLAEDQDLTIQVRKMGYHIGYEESAIGYTEAPDTLRDLAKQRFRWSFGTLQCMWQHKSALFNPRYGTLGFIAMPNVWIFQVLFPLISPLMDLMFVWTIISATIGYFEHQKEYAHTPTNLNSVVFYYALFLALDWAGAFAAFLMERSEQKSLLWWLTIQRFGYRQVMYWVMVKSVVTAIRGVIVGWGKLDRKSTVEVSV